MKHIRESKVIDRNAPQVVDVFDNLRDTLIKRHGITKARYYHLAASAGGLVLKVSASPPIRALAVDFVENRRHELLCDLVGRMCMPEPTRFVPDGGSSAEGIPEPLRTARQRYHEFQNGVIGEEWWHRFDVPTFGPGPRGLFLINAPLEQRLTDAYMAEVRRDLQDFHLAFSRAEQQAEDATPVLTANERDFLLGLAGGLRMKELAERLGLSSTRGAEERLKRIRDKLGCETPAEAVAKAVRFGLIV